MVPFKPTSYLWHAELSKKNPEKHFPGKVNNATSDHFWDGRDIQLMLSKENFLTEITDSNQVETSKTFRNLLCVFALKKKRDKFKTLWKKQNKSLRKLLKTNVSKIVNWDPMERGCWRMRWGWERELVEGMKQTRWGFSLTLSRLAENSERVSTTRKNLVQTFSQTKKSYERRRNVLGDSVKL